MSTDNRTIVPGLWSDAFAGLDPQGLARVRVQLVDQDGNSIAEALPLQVAISELLPFLRTGISQEIGKILKELKEIKIILEEGLSN